MELLKGLVAGHDKSADKKQHKKQSKEPESSI
jgi:hypothetical protein